MPMTATTLGHEYGLSAQEMNRVLVKEGILGGIPGDYYLTEKGKAFGEEEYHHRGCGGYSRYNRSWTTRLYDDSITDFLNVTDDLISEVRMDMAQERAARKAESIGISPTITTPVFPMPAVDDLIPDPINRPITPAVDPFPLNTMNNNLSTGQVNAAGVASVVGIVLLIGAFGKSVWDKHKKKVALKKAKTIEEEK